MYIYPLFFFLLQLILFPFRLLQSAEHSSLCCTVDSCWLSTVNRPVCTCPSQSPHLSPLSILRLDHHKWVCFSFVSKFSKPLVSVGMDPPLYLLLTFKAFLYKIISFHKSVSWRSCPGWNLFSWIAVPKLSRIILRLVGWSIPSGNFLQTLPKEKQWR